MANMQWFSVLIIMIYLNLVAFASSSIVLRNESASFQELMDTLPRDPEGILHVGGDGVIRSLSATKEVLGFVQLTPEELKRMVERRLSSNSKTRRDPELARQYIEERWAGVDGRTVTDLDELLHPRGEATTPWAASGEIDKRAECGCGKICDRDREEMELLARSAAAVSGPGHHLFRRACAKYGQRCNSATQCGKGCICVYWDCVKMGLCDDYD